MFTGIIEDLGIVKKINRQGITIQTNLSDIKVSDSIAVNGVCLTISQLTTHNSQLTTFTTDISEETFRRTNLGQLTTGEKVNLERSLKANSLLGGHIVLGHVETTGKIVDIKSLKNSKIFTISLPGEFSKYIVPKGSIAVDGISLTVVDVKLIGTYNFQFTVSIIPYTLKNTTFGFRKLGDKVNIEPDILAKYVLNLCSDYNNKTKITKEYLIEKGFI